jgi:hypothetical protein
MPRSPGGVVENETMSEPHEILPPSPDERIADATERIHDTLVDVVGELGKLVDGLTKALEHWRTQTD